MCKGEGEGVDAISAVRFNLLGAPKRIHRDNAAEYSSEHCSRYTKRANHTHTTPTYTRAGRRLKRESYLVIQRIARSAHQAGDVSMHRRISPALPGIRVAFAPGGVPVVNSHVRLLHLHFCTSSRQHTAPCQSLTDMSIPHRHVNPSQPCQSLTDTAGTYHTAPASFQVHGVARTV